MAFGAGLAATFYGPLIYFGGELLPTIPAIVLNLLLLLHLSRQPSPARWPYLVSGLLLGICALAVANILLFLPFLLFYLWSTSKRAHIALSRILQQGVLLLLGCGLLIAPVALRNYLVGGDLVLISHNAGINFYIGNNPDYDHTVNIRPGQDWIHLIESPEREAGIERPSSKSRFFFARSWAYIADAPLDYLKLLGRKLYLFWHGDEIRRNLDPYFARRDSTLLQVLLWKFGLAFPFGLVGPFALLGLAFFWVQQRSPYPPRTSAVVFCSRLYALGDSLLRDCSLSPTCRAYFVALCRFWPVQALVHISSPLGPGRRSRGRSADQLGCRSNGYGRRHSAALLDGLCL